MRLLIVTQKVDRNDSVLGFFHQWIVKFAENCDKVIVVALGTGEYELPQNVRVFSLGKERRVSRFSYVVNFIRIIWRERRNYDVVFVHMNPIYVLLGGFLWKACRKKIGLWYTHKHVDLKLRIAEKIAHVIFTASRESFRLKSNKIIAEGHGIDLKTFKRVEKTSNIVMHIVTAGRISPVKDYVTLIEVIAVLVKEKIPVQVSVIGGPTSVADQGYLKSLEKLVQEKNLEQVIRFVGPISNRNLPAYLQEADIFINMSRTGSLDKAVLEAMACEIPVITSNQAFGVFFGLDATMLMFQEGDIAGCINLINDLRELSVVEKRALGGRLRAVIEKEHNIEVLIPRILSHYEVSH